MNIIFNPASDADLQQIITDALAADGDILVNDPIFVEVSKAKWEDKKTAKALKKDAKDEEKMADLFIKVAEDADKVITKLGNSESWDGKEKKVLNGNYHPVSREELQTWKDVLGITAFKVKNPIVVENEDII